MIPGPVDTALDRLVVPGYTKVGYWVRRLGWERDDPRPGSLAGKRALVTGANSGLGKATALGLARLGAEVHLVVRNEDKGRSALVDLRGELPGGLFHLEVCDVSDPDSVRRLCADLVERLDRVDVLVHNAGVMPPQRTESADGHELTMAVHVLGPVLMTELLRPVLAGHDARVVLVSSGGMYTQRLPVEDPEYTAGGYRGAVAYARSKRTQVAMGPLLQQRWAGDGITVHVMHPGWADTPGVADSLPLFRTVTGPLLRDAEVGADTIVWLAATAPAPPGGRFWQDRRARPEHYRKATEETEQERTRMWAWVRAAVGIDATDAETS